MLKRLLLLSLLSIEILNGLFAICQQPHHVFQSKYFIVITKLIKKIKINTFCLFTNICILCYLVN